VGLPTWGVLWVAEIYPPRRSTPPLLGGDFPCHPFRDGSKALLDYNLGAKSPPRRGAAGRTFIVRVGRSTLPTRNLNNLSNTNDFAASAVNALNLRSHPIARYDIFSSTDATWASKFGTSNDNLEHLLISLPRTAQIYT
jgi:hypothetical protein